MEENKKTTKEVKEEKIEVVEVVPENNEPQAEQTIKTEKDVENSKGLSIASMVLGIVSICFFYTEIISVVSAVLAIVFGEIGQKRANKKQAKAGFIMGIIALALRVFLIIFGAIFLVFFLSIIKSL